MPFSVAMASKDENRAVQLTAPGSSALAIVRLIGPRIDDFLTRHFSRPVPIGRVVHGNLTSGNETLDDPVIVRTSPTSIDISLHGSPYVVEAVLTLARSMDFLVEDQLSSATFPEVDAVWADVLASLPNARTPLAVRALLAQPDAWNRGRPSPTDRTLHTLLSLPTVALVGPANLGKSTLANTLFGQQRSIVADLPGTTRDWVGGIADIGGLAVTLIDTPGMRDTTDAVEQAAQAASLGPIAAADLVVVVLDHSAPITAAERELIERHRVGLRVANKSDRAPAWSASEEDAIETVATHDAGVERLRSAVLRFFGCDNFDTDLPRMWTEHHLTIGLPEGRR